MSVRNLLLLMFCARLLLICFYKTIFRLQIKLPGPVFLWVLARAQKMAFYSCAVKDHIAGFLGACFPRQEFAVLPPASQEGRSLL